MNHESRSRNLGVAGWLIVATFAVVFLPMARANEDNRPKDQAPRGDSVRVVRTVVKAEVPRKVTRVVRHEATGSTTETAILRELAPMIPPLRDQFVEINRLAVNDGKLSDALALLRKARPGFDAFMDHAREIALEPQMAEVMATLDKLDTALQQNNLDESRRILKQLGHMGEAIEKQLKQGQEPDGSKGEQEVPPIPQEPLPPGTTMVGYVGDKEQGKRSIATSGHGVRFTRPAKARWIEAVQIFAGRYGTQQPPEEDFHLYVLNSDMQILADVKYPYATIGRGDLTWYTLRTPSIEVPEEFVVALSFDPHETKGIYLGYDKPQGASRSLTGLPDDGYMPDKRGWEWMVRTHLCEQPTGDKGTMRLADWKPPVKETPFRNCIEAKFDNGTADDMQSYGSRGPAIRIRPSDFLTTASAKEWELAGFTLYASRYGAGYDPAKTMVQVTVLDPNNQVLEQTEVSYGTFGYKPRWVAVPLSKALKIAKPGDMLTVAFDPKARQTKGIYFHYNKNPQTSHSLAGTVEKGFEPTPDREWMIRCHFAPAGGQKEK